MFCFAGVSNSLYKRNGYIPVERKNIKPLGGRGENGKCRRVQEKVQGGCSQPGKKMVQPGLLKFYKVL